MRDAGPTLAHPPKRTSNTGLIVGLVAVALFSVSILGGMVVAAGVAAFLMLQGPPVLVPSAPIPAPPAEAVVPDGP